MYELTSLYFVICSSAEKETLSALGLPSGHTTPFRAILVSLAWSLELNLTQQVDLIPSIQKSSIVPVLFNISWNDLTVKGLVRLVMRRNSISLSSSVKVILFFLMVGSSWSLLTDLGILGPAISGSDSTLAVSPE